MSDQVKAFLDVPAGGKPKAENSRLFFCRGARCAQPDKDTRKVKCEDCILPREDETIGEVAQRIARGDA